MKYGSGAKICTGDQVSIDTKYKGIVVANNEAGDYSDKYPKEEWSRLKIRVLTDTDFGGVVHFEQEGLLAEEVTLLNRA